MMDEPIKPREIRSAFEDTLPPMPPVTLPMGDGTVRVYNSREALAADFGEPFAAQCVGPAEEKRFVQPADLTVGRDKHAQRKAQPIFHGCIAYFPDALLAIAELSLIGNEQHHPGKPLHWEFGKSADQQDCLVRHLIDYDELDDDGVLHAKKTAWRALANLQTLIESRNPELHAKRQAQRDRAARGER